MLARSDPRTKRPEPVRAEWPVKVRDAGGGLVPDAEFLVQYLHLEEKGSDVNVASHLLLDVLSGSVDAAMVISNDSDRRCPFERLANECPSHW